MSQQQRPAYSTNCRPDFIRYGSRPPEYVIKCHNGCGWYTADHIDFLGMPKRPRSDLVRCRCGAEVPYQEGFRL